MTYWRITLACFLILFGLLQITNVRFELQGFLLGVTAILVACGGTPAILLLFNR